MIIYLLGELLIGIIVTLLTPFTAIVFIFPNVFGDAGFLYLMKFLSVFIPRASLVFIMSSFAFWLEIFAFKPLFDFFRKRLQG